MIRIPRWELFLSVLCSFVLGLLADGIWNVLAHG